jgi:hypothetical protein
MVLSHFSIPSTVCCSPFGLAKTLPVRLTFLWGSERHGFHARTQCREQNRSERG